MCKVLQLTRSGYYAWCKRKISPRIQENEILSDQIKQIHQASRETYGSPRIHAALVAKGFQVGRQRVGRLMAKLGIGAHPKRKFKATTDSEHDLPIAQNVLDRGFTTTEPDRTWVADMTYIWTTEGWLYLAVMIDLFSRRVVGWSMAEYMHMECFAGESSPANTSTELVLTALDDALGQRIPSPTGLVFHSDRGSQYASGDCRDALFKADITASMSRRANCWDNAVAESFFGTLKIKLIYPRIFSTRADSWCEAFARTSIAEWIEVFYNRQRIHSTLGYLTSVQFEESDWSILDHTMAA
jgi:putative transposase